MNFSIITCTYNPPQKIFNRLTKSIDDLEVPDNSKIEWLIIDNNSNPPLSEADYIREKPFTRIIYEPKQGLTNARIRGISEAKYDWVVFFDDDNEPAKDYLIEIKNIILSNKKIACLGPGIINVEFIGNVKSNWVKNKKDEFQERCFVETQICKEPDCEFLPPGTGLIIKKDCLSSYLEKINSGKYTMTDRKGNSLISGGDTQMVLDILKQGFYSGIIPGMKLNHLISAKKAKRKYLLRLKYWTASSYIKVYNEVFIENQFNLEYVSNFKILKKIISILRVKRKEPFNDILLTISDRLGEINARYIAGRIKSPIILKIWERLIR